MPELARHLQQFIWITVLETGNKALILMSITSAFSFRSIKVLSIALIISAIAVNIWIDVFYNIPSASRGIISQSLLLFARIIGAVFWGVIGWTLARLWQWGGARVRDQKIR